jgi:hypothetical protein
MLDIEYLDAKAGVPVLGPVEHLLDPVVEGGRRLRL